MWFLLQVLAHLNPQKVSKETKNMNIGSPSSILKFWTMSPLATLVLHCPYGPGTVLSFSGRPAWRRSFIWHDAYPHTTGCVSTSQPQEPLNIGMYLDLGKKHIYWHYINIKKRWLLGGHVWLLGGACVVAGGAWVCVVAGGCAWLLGGHVWLPGGCVWLLGGMHGCRGGHAWLPGGVVARVACVVARGHAWLLGGVRGCWGACMVAGGHVWLPGGMRGCQGGHVWLLGGMWGCQGACVVAGGACVVVGGCVVARGACMVAGGHAWLLGWVCVLCDLSHHAFDVTCMLSQHQLRASSYAPAYILVGHVTCMPPPVDRQTPVKT